MVLWRQWIHVLRYVDILRVSAEVLAARPGLLVLACAASLVQVGLALGGLAAIAGAGYALPTMVYLS